MGRDARGLAGEGKLQDFARKIEESLHNKYRSYLGKCEALIERLWCEVSLSKRQEKQLNKLLSEEKAKGDSRMTSGSTIPKSMEKGSTSESIQRDLNIES